jgi:hypothetical protein
MTEAHIQQQIVRYYHNTFCLTTCSPRCMILSIPNEGKPELIATGLYPGAADLLVIHYGRMVFIEVKTETGAQSANQKRFQQHCRDIEVPYHLVRSVEEFKKIFCSP